MAILGWMGGAFQLLGVLLAAKGISDVRQQWTDLPGIWTRVNQVFLRFSNNITGLFWKAWNRIAIHFQLPVHQPPRVEVSGHSESTIGGSGQGSVTRPAAPSSGTTDERLAWLEAQMGSTQEEIDSMGARLTAEAQARGAGDQEERLARSTAVENGRQALANLAGGGLRLQAWGVSLLLLGIILTTISSATSAN